MAGSKTKTPVIEWSEAVYSVKEAVNKLGTPCMVRVVVGCDDPAFIETNYLKLDFGINIRKVGANFVSDRPGSSSETKEEVLLPMGYKGKVKVVRKDAGTKIFTCVQDLIKEFPRFVQVEETLSGQEEGSNKNVKIASGVKLELLKVIGKELYCKHQDKLIKLVSQDKVKCRLLQDDNVYTLYEVIDRLPLPQIIKIQDADFKKTAKFGLSREKCVCDKITDTLEIKRITNHEVVVGLLKPSPEVGGSGTLKKVKQTISLFVLASNSVNDIKVNIPKDKKDKLYNSTMMRMFPAEVERFLISESLFVDLASNMNVHLLKEDNNWHAVKANKPKAVVEPKLKPVPVQAKVEPTPKATVPSVDTTEGTYASGYI